MDSKHVKTSRRTEIINRSLDKEIDFVQRRYEINKQAFIAKMI